MPISEKNFLQLIDQCGFLAQQDNPTRFLFQSENYKNHEEEDLITLAIERKKKGKMIHIHTVDLYQIPSSATFSIFTTLSIITHHLPGLAFSYDPTTGEIRLQSCIFVPQGDPTSALLRIHVNLLLKTIEHYHEEMTYAIENDALHDTFLPSTVRQKKIEDLHSILEELQNLVNEEEQSPSQKDDDDSSDDIEWL